MLRLITCQSATLLLEQHAGQPASGAMPSSLWLHLRYCRHCKRYAEQTVLIAEWAKAGANARASTDFALSDATKQRMRERLAAAE
jgi:hypothetical protein